MDTKRETKIFETSRGHKVEIKTYLTGREFNEIQAVYLQDVKLDTVGQEIKLSGFNPSAEQKANNRTIELLAVSFDGSSDDILNKVLDLPHDEYDEVIAQLSEVSGKKKS